MIDSCAFGLRALTLTASVLAITASPVTAHLHAQTPLQIVSTMAANEVGARNQDQTYEFMSDEVSDRTGGHRWTEKVVETNVGPLARLLAIDGRPLTPAEVKTEADRIDETVRHPAELRRLGQAHKDEEVRAQHLLQLMPKAFLLTPAGEANGCMRFAFRPNPAFQPSTYEERVAVAMEGFVSVQEPAGRLCGLQARFIHPITFGFGLIGRIEEGGHFDLQRTQVDPVHWKSDRISVHIQGRILLLKALTREQEVTRTHLVLISPQLSLEQAARMTAE